MDDAGGFDRRQKALNLGHGVNQALYLGILVGECKMASRLDVADLKI
jgi:hypothetical protein